MLLCYLYEPKPFRRTILQETPAVGLPKGKLSSQQLRQIQRPTSSTVKENPTTNSANTEMKNVFNLDNSKCCFIPSMRLERLRGSSESQLPVARMSVLQYTVHQDQKPSEYLRKYQEVTLHPNYSSIYKVEVINTALTMVDENVVPTGGRRQAIF